jgi:hypothetical protein
MLVRSFEKKSAYWGRKISPPKKSTLSRSIKGSWTKLAFRTRSVKVVNFSMGKKLPIFNQTATLPMVNSRTISLNAILVVI